MNTPESGKAYLRITEVADELKVSDKTIRRRIHSKELPAIRRGRILYVSTKDLTNYMEEGRL